MRKILVTILAGLTIGFNAPASAATLHNAVDVSHAKTQDATAATIFNSNESVGLEYVRGFRGHRGHGFKKSFRGHRGHGYHNSHKFKKFHHSNGFGKKYYTTNL